MSEISRRATGKHTCVGVSRIVHQRLKAVSEARGPKWSMARIVETVIVERSDCSICGVEPGRRCEQLPHILAYRARMAQGDT